MRVPGAGRRGLRIVGALAISAATVEGHPASQAPEGFLIAARADVQSRPSDPAAVSVSADGRFVAFESYARLAVGDANDLSGIYVLDRATGALSLETPVASAAGRTAGATEPRLSASGRFLAYQTMADLDGVPLRVLALRDRLTGVTRVLLNGGRLPNGGCRTASISAAGDMIAFGSSATNLVDGHDANGSGDDVYLLDAVSMVFRRVSLDSNGRQSASGSSFAPAISADGRYVAFSSTAPLDALRPSRGRGVKIYVDVYRRDLTLGVTTRISVAADGGVANGSSYDAAISADGRYVAFVSDATNLVKRHDGNRAPDVYLRDTVAGVTELISRTRSGESANGPSAHPAISHDGRVVVFQSGASDLACGADCVVADRDINLVADIFAHDRVRGATRRVSRGSTQWMEPSIGPAIDASGGVIAFSSRHPLDAADDRDDYDLFVWSPGR